MGRRDDLDLRPLVGRTALVFTAVLVLNASALEIGVLTALDIVPGLLFGLIAGVWVDRLPRRMIMIVADLGRAALLVTIPLAYALDGLTMGQLFAVAVGTGMLTIFFDVAYQTYLPALVSREHLVEGNSKMAASAAAAEVGGFSLSGFLVQLLKGPYTILVDSASFLWSALVSEAADDGPGTCPAVGRVALALSSVWASASPVQHPVALDWPRGLRNHRR